MELLAVIGIAYALFLFTLPFLLWLLWQRVRRLTDRLYGLERQRQPTEAVAAAQEESTVPTPVVASPTRKGDLAGDRSSRKRSE